jgi:MFS family permease
MLTCYRTWRWCFYINLPVGGFTILATLLFLHIDPPKHENYTLFQQLRRLDPVGVLFFVPAMVCLVLALQWGGTTYTWSSGRVIGLLVTYAVLFVIFIVVEVLTPDTAMAPMRVVLNRSVAGSMTYTFLLSGGMMVIIYYFTIWFQAAKGDSAIRSGIATIPLVLSLVLASIISAVVTQKIGYYVPAMIISCVMCAIGSGLLSTLKVDSYHGYWIGYQVLYGLGVGCGFQQSNLSVQTVLKRQDVPLGIALMFLQQQMGGSIFLSVSQSIFSNKLVNKLSGVAGLDPHVIVNTGATDLRKVVPVNELSTVVSAYSYALTRTFLLAAILSACMILGAGVVEWRSIKEKNTHKSEGESEESKLEQGQAAQEKPGGYS